MPGNPCGGQYSAIRAAAPTSGRRSTTSPFPQVAAALAFALLRLMGDDRPLDALRSREAQRHDCRRELDLHRALIRLRRAQSLARENAGRDEILTKAGELAHDGPRLGERTPQGL